MAEQAVIPRDCIQIKSLTVQQELREEEVMGTRSTPVESDPAEVPIATILQTEEVRTGLKV